MAEARTPVRPGPVAPTSESLHEDARPLEGRPRPVRLPARPPLADGVPVRRQARSRRVHGVPACRLAAVRSHALPAALPGVRRLPLVAGQRRPLPTRPQPAPLPKGERGGGPPANRPSGGYSREGRPARPVPCPSIRSQGLA